MAATTFMKGWQDFDLIQLVIQPLFLFSGTFFPVSQYPPALQWVVQVSPLYHGTELLRAVMLDHFDWSIVGHVGFLVAMGSIGLAVTRRRFEKLLLP
jgi:lipooligosaccharide transport system permease protein